MFVRDFDIGDVIRIADRLWGGGEYHCMIIDIPKVSFKYYAVVLHPNGLDYIVNLNHRCAEGEYENYAGMRQAFQAENLKEIR